jgi:hypothetical protein
MIMGITVLGYLDIKGAGRGILAKRLRSKTTEPLNL